MKVFTWLVCVCFPMFLPALARAGLTFEKTEISQKAAHNDTEVSGEFKFKVTGDKPVKILDIATYCDCLKAKSKDGRMEFKNGEEGVIETTFRLGSFEGEIAKQVSVTTNEPGAQDAVLTVKVTIPQVFQIEPEHLKWEVGEEAKTKKIKFKVLGDKPIAVTGLVSSRENMLAEFKEVSKGREYEISMTPASTAEPVMGVLRVETDAPWMRFQKRLLFFNVTRPKPAAPPKP